MSGVGNQDIMTTIELLDVAMLQETHLKNTEAVFSAPGTRASRGVRTLIAKRLSFKLTQEIVDKNGRHIIRSGFLHNIKCTLVNVNAPNIGQTKFLPRLNFFLDFSADPIVIGGHFNLVSDPAVDRSSPTLPTDRSLPVAFKELNKSLAIYTEASPFQWSILTFMPYMSNPY
uniref:Endonuclease/exonuclease/phosphatase domain-containing protein n=1 Tax=Gadus morhua TaxID=8049 RepID=A0A8C5AEY3_GADMO